MPESPIHLVLITVILLCLLIAAAQYFATRHIVILRYVAYLSALAAHYTRDYLVHYSPLPWRTHLPDFPLRWDSPTALVCYALYALFIADVFQLKDARPAIYRLFRLCTFLFLVFAVLHVLLQLLFDYRIAQYLYHPARFLLFPISIVAIFYLSVKRRKLMHQRLVLAGTVILVISVIQSMTRMIWPIHRWIPDVLHCANTGLIPICLPPVRIGILLEILCFSWAMAFFVKHQSSMTSQLPPKEDPAPPATDADAPEPVFPSPHPFAQQVAAYIESRLSDETMAVADVCRFVSLSNSQVTRKLKELCGLSTEQFIQRYRMHRAFEMLQAGDRRVGEVATAVGFKEVAYFSRVFRQTFGVTPSEVRKRL